MLHCGDIRTVQKNVTTTTYTLNDTDQPVYNAYRENLLNVLHVTWNVQVQKFEIQHEFVSTLDIDTYVAHYNKICKQFPSLAQNENKVVFNALQRYDKRIRKELNKPSIQTTSLPKLLKDQVDFILEYILKSKFNSYSKALVEKSTDTSTEQITHMSITHKESIDFSQPTWLNTYFAEGEEICRLDITKQYWQKDIYTFSPISSFPLCCIVTTTPTIVPDGECPEVLVSFRLDKLKHLKLVLIQTLHRTHYVLLVITKITTSEILYEMRDDLKQNIYEGRYEIGDDINDCEKVPEIDSYCTITQKGFVVKKNVKIITYYIDYID